jgi:enoyl-CoA hydratase/carnithine racemase
LEYETLQFEVRDHVGWLVLNRPDKGNALSLEMVRELRQFFADLEKNLDIRIVVMRSAGKHFCIGLDMLSSFGAGQSEINPAAGLAPTRFDPRGCRIQWEFSDIIVKMRQAPQPIIASMRGVALGGGFSIALACDIRLASETARFNIGTTRIGFSGGDMGSSYFLPRLIGLSKAAEYVYTARWIDATTAERIGLISRAVPDEQLDRTTDDLVQEMLNVSPFALRMTKEVLYANVDAPSLEQAVKLENRTQLMCGFTQDAMEAIKAVYVERRRPVYEDK